MPRIASKKTKAPSKRLTVSEEDAWVDAHSALHSTDASLTPERSKIFFARSCSRCGHLPVSIHTLIGLFGLTILILSLFVLLSVMKIQALSWQLQVMSDPSIVFPLK